MGISYSLLFFNIFDVLLNNHQYEQLSTLN